MTRDLALKMMLFVMSVFNRNCEIIQNLEIQYLKESLIDVYAEFSMSQAPQWGFSIIELFEKQDTETIHLSNSPHFRHLVLEFSEGRKNHLHLGASRKSGKSPDVPSLEKGWSNLFKETSGKTIDLDSYSVGDHIELANSSYWGGGINPNFIFS